MVGITIDGWKDFMFRNYKSRVFGHRYQSFESFQNKDIVIQIKRTNE